MRNILYHIRFVFFYFIAWLLFFQLFRVAFLLYNKQILNEVPLSLQLKSMWIGMRMDAAMASYLLVPIILFFILAIFFSFFNKVVVYKVYTIICSVLILALCVIDLGSYNIWGFRLDMTPFQFLNNPKEAWASISHLPIFYIGAIIIIFLLLIFFLWNRFFTLFFYAKPAKPIYALVVYVLLLGLLIIPMRGGLQLAPMNQSTVYFSTNVKANQAALNPIWNLLYALSNSGSVKKNLYPYFSEDMAKSIVDSMYQYKSDTVGMKHIFTHTPTQVILIIWESFTEKVVDKKFVGVEVTPGINQLLHQGIFFANNYASGDRTNKGLSAILSGYPALPQNSIIQYPSKAGKLPTLAAFFAERHYHTTFLYGGEPEFANIKSYILNGGFQKLISKESFSAADMNSKWGAHDGVVADKLFGLLNGEDTTKNFITWLTLSSHEPFETPVPTAIKGSDDESMFVNSLHYTDAVVFNFINKLKTLPIWNNTLIIISGDHGHGLPRVSEKQLDFRTPMLWLGGCIKMPFIFPQVSSQLDIASSLTCQIVGNNYFPFSKNLFAGSYQPWAFFDFNDGFGIVDSTGYVVYDNIGNKEIQAKGKNTLSLSRQGKAMMQYSYNDFFKR